MGKLLPIASLVVIVGLCAAVAVETQTLFRLKAEVARLRELAAATEQRAQLAQKETAQVREENQTYKGESEELRKQIGGGTDAAGSLAASPDAKAGPGGFMKNLSKMFTDPEMKKAMRGQQGMAARMMYADFIKQSGLASGDADKLIDLLTDRQMEAAGKGMTLFGEKDAEKQAASTKELEQSRTAFNDQLKNLLGDAGFQQLEQYDKTVGDRMMMQQYQTQFSATGQPLEDSQKEALLRIMAEERAKVPPSVFDPGNADPAAQFKALQSDQAVHDLLAYQNDLNQRVLARAGEVLSSGQLVAFQKIQGQMAEMQQAGIKMSRSMFQQ